MTPWWSLSISQQQWTPGTKKVYPCYSSDMWAPTEFLGTYELPLIFYHSTYNDQFFLLPKATPLRKVQCHILYLISVKFAFVTLFQINGLVSWISDLANQKSISFFHRHKGVVGLLAKRLVDRSKPLQLLDEFGLTSSVLFAASWRQHVEVHRTLDHD